MSFWDRFESKQDGIEDTIEFTIRMAVVTLAMVILVVVAAMVAGMFVSNDIVDSEKVFEIIGPAFNTIVGAFVGLLGGLLNVGVGAIGGFNITTNMVQWGAIGIGVYCVGSWLQTIRLRDPACFALVANPELNNGTSQHLIFSRWIKTHAHWHHAAFD